jgi:DNA repair exonuclease SbcCD ATPase subunit
MEIVGILLGVANFGLLLYILTKKQGTGLDSAMRDEFMRNRKEFADANKDLRQELTGGLAQSREGLEKRLEQLRDKNDEKLEAIRKTVDLWIGRGRPSHPESPAYCSDKTRNLRDWS